MDGTRRRAAPILGLGLVMLLAFAARALGAEQVFLDDGTVVFALGDAFYHARRALFSFVHFPGLLLFDPCLNHPDGSVIPHPPLLDWVVAGVARLFGARVATFELVAAWSPVVFGTLTLIPVHALGRRLGGPAVGLGAALLYALLPVTINYTQVGNPDHHAAAGLLGALLLAGYVAALDEPDDRAGRWPLFLGLALARVALVLTWNGGLLYLVPGEVALVLAAAHRGSAPLLRAQAASCGLAFALLALAVALLPVANGGPWSSTELSRLQPLGFAGAALLCAGLLLLERRKASASGWHRLLRLGGLALAIGLCALLLPGLWEGLAPAFGFLAKSDQYTSLVLEQLPLFFEQGGTSRAAGERRLGYFAYLLPFLPLIFIFESEDRERRAAWMLLFAWSLMFGMLALQQVRYAHDYAPAAAVGFALVLRRGARALEGRGLPPRAAGVAALLAGALLLAPTVWLHFRPASALTLAWLRGELAGMDRGLLSFGGTQVRFAQRVAAATPDAAGCGPAEGVPDYGILAHPAIGHVLHYTARRATPADPFGPYIGQENFDATMAFLTTESEDEAVAIAGRLRTPFVLTAEEAGDRPATVLERLQRHDGSAHGDFDHLGRFRLVEDGPEGGVPIAWFLERERREAVPYKLFQVVEGARLEVGGAPGAVVVAELDVRAPSGRRFAWRARARVEADGVARLRLPYPTRGGSDAATAARGVGPYRIRGRGELDVSEAEVREGARVGLEAPQPR